MNKASGGGGIPVELFQILKFDAVKVLHSICQQIWKTQQWPQDWKRSVFIPIPKKGNAKECSNYCTIALISHTSKVKLLSHVQLFATLWTVAYQAPPSMEFSRQEYWNGLPFPSPGDLPSPGIEPGSPTWWADALPFEPLGNPTGYKVMLKILQARLQQYVNRELPDVQVGFRKGRGTRDQIANIRWIIEKARVFQKNIYFCFTDYDKAFVCITTTVENSERDGIPHHLICLLRNL